jgi:hypothetical protein
MLAEVREQEVLEAEPFWGKARRVREGERRVREGFLKYRPVSCCIN